MRRGVWNKVLSPVLRTHSILGRELSRRNQILGVSSAVPNFSPSNTAKLYRISSAFLILRRLTSGSGWPSERQVELNECLIRRLVSTRLCGLEISPASAFAASGEGISRSWGARAWAVTERGLPWGARFGGGSFPAPRDGYVLNVQLTVDFHLVESVVSAFSSSCIFSS